MEEKELKTNSDLNKKVEKQIEEEVEGQDRLIGYSAKIVMWAAIAMTVYHIYIIATGVPEPFVLRPIHLGFAMFLGFTLYAFSKKKERKKVPWYDWVLALLSLAIPLHIQINYERITTRFAYFDEMTALDMFFGVSLVVLILELTRRVLGWGLVILALIFIVYSLLGTWMPGALYHPGVDFKQFIDHIYLTNTGVYGSLVGISATFIFLFILFGVFLQQVGASNFFMNMAISATKRERGGPAKASVFASAFFGMISGSTVANVYTTGSITIPLMIKTGFKRHFAGGVEAVSSASGQVMPPVMGATAFLIAEFTQTRYIDVALAAIIPSFLYLLSIYWMVHFQAMRTDLPVYRDEDIPNMKKVFKRDIHLLIPIFVLIILLVQGFTPYYAAVYAILALVITSFIRAHSRLNVKKLLFAMEDGAKKATPIAVAIGCAAVIVSTTELTGIAYKFTYNILDLAGGSLLFALILIGVATIILGMDLPVVVSFIIASLFGVPVLMELGIDRFTAHMFVFYYAILAGITPPVCMGAYAAASIAGSRMLKTGLTAVSIGTAAYILPFIIVYNPNILYQGDFLLSLSYAITAAIGIIALASAVQGYFVTHSRWYERVLLFIVALLLIKPGIVTDTSAIAILLLVALLQSKRIQISPIKSFLGKVEIENKN